MNESVDTTCHCKELDDDLIEGGSTCYNCYKYRKDNNSEESN